MRCAACEVGCKAAGWGLLERAGVAWPSSVPAYRQPPKAVGCTSTPGTNANPPPRSDVAMDMHTILRTAKGEEIPWGFGKHQYTKQALSFKWVPD